MSETNQEWEIRKLREEVYGLTKVLRKLTGVIEKATEPVIMETTQTIPLPEGIGVTFSHDQAPLITMTAEAAVGTLRSICQDAAHCGRDGCPIFDWCQEHLPGESTAPKDWANLQ